MRGSKDQIRFQRAIERPEEELETIRIHGGCVHRLVWRAYAGETCTKEVEIVCFKTLPDADILGHVFREFHQDRREGLALSAREMERLRRQGTLGFGEESGQLLGDFRQGAFATSKTSPWSMGTKIVSPQ